MRTRTWFSCALTAALLVGCSGDPAPPASPPPDVAEEPTPEPEPEPEPEPLQDVAGTVAELTVVDISEAGSGLYPDGSAADAGIPVDQEAVEALAAAAVAWLDGHLTDVQSGGPGKVVDAGLVGDTTGVSAHLTGPEHPVIDASYVITVGARGGPEWLRASATVDREDGTMSATFVFLPGGGGVSLVAAQPGAGTPAQGPV